MVRVALFALVFSAINAFKPIHIDDGSNFFFAHHFAQDPLDPYGFWLLWVDVPEPAMNILTPPVFDYYWAALIKLFGISPALWKLGCFPIYFLYLASIHFIATRFAPSVVWPTLVLIVFSPIVFPGTNMMLDVPAQSLFYAGLACFILACDRKSVRHLGLAALLAGLCIETKYTGLILLPTLLLYGALNRKVSYAVAVTAGALAVVGAIESAIYLASGASHFLVHSISTRPTSLPLMELAQGLSGQLGGGGIGLLGIALLALQIKQRPVLGILMGWLALAFASILVDPGTGRTILRGLAHGTGIAILVAMLFAIIRLNIPNSTDVPDDPPWDPITVFLSLWLLGEIAFYFLVSPFPAMRRIIGIATVGTLLFARWVDRRKQKPSGQLLAIATVPSLLISLIFFTVDAQWAGSMKESVTWATAEIGEVEPDQTVWYHGIWGFKYYAAEAGMKTFISGQTEVAEGDYLLLPKAGVALPRVEIDMERWELVGEYRGGPAAHLRISNYYNGTTPLSVGRREAVRVALYRWR